MQHSPKDQHTHDMLDFFLNLIVGSELAPQVRVPSSLPVLYISVKAHWLQSQMDEVKAVKFFFLNTE